MAEINNHELVRMLRRYAKWIKDKSDNSFQKNQNLWKLILLSAERLYQYEQYQEETDAYKQGEWDMFELITSVEYGKQRFCDDFCGTVYDRSKCDHLKNRDEAIDRYLKEIGDNGEY